MSTDNNKRDGFDAWLFSDLGELESGEEPDKDESEQEFKLDSEFGDDSEFGEDSEFGDDSEFEDEDFMGLSSDDIDISDGDIEGELGLLDESEMEEDSLEFSDKSLSLLDELLGSMKDMHFEDEKGIDIDID